MKIQDNIISWISTSFRHKSSYKFTQASVPPVGICGVEKSKTVNAINIILINILLIINYCPPSEDLHGLLISSIY